LQDKSRRGCLLVAGQAQIVTLTLWRFESLAAKLWVFGQMGLARPGIASMAGLNFFKLVGTGAGAGFSTTPNFARYGLFAAWKDMKSAQYALAATPAVKRLSARACETVTLYLTPTQSRGHWGGAEPFHIDSETHATGPIVALTRATLKAKHIARFWSLVPAISSTVENEDQQHFMLGLGEIPYRNQITFSIWGNEADMVRFSRSSPAHGEAVRRAYQEGWFAESLFARFNLLQVDGSWKELRPVQSLLDDLARKRLALNDERKVVA